MDLKKNLSWLGMSIAFLLIGARNLLLKNYLIGSMYIVIGVIYIFVSRANYKSDTWTKRIKSTDVELKNMDIELKDLIDKGKKKKAIRTCRMTTGLGLKEAIDYVDTLN